MRHAVSCVFALLLLACWSPEVRAADLHVSATVLPRSTLQLRGVPGALTISADDVARGFVAAPAPITLTVRGNGLQGLMLVFAATSEMVSETIIEGLGPPVVLGPTGGTWLLPSGSRGLSTSLRIRFRIIPATQPGTWAWPLQVSAAL